MFKRPSKESLAKGMVLTLLALAALTFDWRVAELRERSRGDDFFQFWAAGRAILRGDDPYDPQTWSQIYEQEGRWRWQTDQPVFLYPLWTAFIFMPLASLPVFWAAFLWAVVTQLLLALSAWLIIRGLRWSRYAEWLPLVIGILITFEPASLTVLFGQLGILLLTLVCGVFYFISRDRYGAAGMLLGFTLVKPQVLILVIPVLLLLMSVQRRWSFVVAFAVTTLGLIVGSWVLVPEWPSRWQANLIDTASVRLTISPTIWGFSRTVATSLQRTDLWGAMSVPSCLSLMAIVAYVWYSTREVLDKGDQLAPLLSSTVIASVLLTPYVLSYDFALLLLPTLTCLWLVQPLPRVTRRSLLASLIACAVPLPWALLAISARAGIETTSMLFPASLLAVLLVCHVSRRRWGGKLTIRAGQDQVPATWGQMEI